MSTESASIEAAQHLASISGQLEEVIALLRGRFAPAASPPHASPIVTYYGIPITSDEIQVALEAWFGAPERWAQFVERARRSGR